MATKRLCALGSCMPPCVDIQKFLIKANTQIWQKHAIKGLDPAIHDVGGAGFAVCHVGSEFITIIIAADCFAFLGYGKPLFLTNFDEAAFETEKLDQQEYTKCLEKEKGDKGRAWDLYFPHYQAKRMNTANKNIGKGGFATLNGDPALPQCWTVTKINLLTNCPSFILLGTDGMLPSHMVDPKRRSELTRKISELYKEGDLSAITNWQDEAEKSLTHIEGWPEATAVELKFI